MSKFRIEHNASRTQLVPLKTNIEDTISHDIDLMASWSNNERRYVINELLRFALMQDEHFQRYKASGAATSASTKPVSRPTTKPEAPATVSASGGVQR
jgi:hypothetical protein